MRRREYVKQRGQKCLLSTGNEVTPKENRGKKNEGRIPNGLANNVDL